MKHTTETQPDTPALDALKTLHAGFDAADLGEMRCWDDHPGYEDVLTVMMWALDEKACKPA